MTKIPVAGGTEGWLKADAAGVHSIDLLAPRLSASAFPTMEDSACAVETNSSTCNEPSSMTRVASAPRCLFVRWKAGRLNVIFVATREVSLFVFTLDLGSTLRRGSVVRGRDVRAVGYEVLLEGLSLPFVQLEHGTVETTVVIKVFNCEEVILLMCEKAHHRASTKRSCSFAQRHRRANSLLVFIPDKDVLNGAYVHLGSRTSILLKLHRVT